MLILFVRVDRKHKQWHNTSFCLYMVNAQMQTQSVGLRQLSVNVDVHHAATNFGHVIRAKALSHALSSIYSCLFILGHNFLLVQILYEHNLLRFCLSVLPDK